MNYTLMSSLEHFALIKTAITLWNPDDVCHLPVKFNFTEDQWEIAENHVTEKVKELPLPESLKKKVLGFIRPIGIEICKWLNCHLESLSDGRIVRIGNLVRKCFRELCWTPQGTVDKKKTAERLIRDEDLSITERYKLACINCLENDILILWNKMPEDCKKSFYSEENPRRVNQNELVVLWTYNIKGEVTRMRDISEEKRDGCTPYQYAFDYAVYSGNKAAAEHFLQKLTAEERKECLERSVYPNKDTLCYLLSQMNDVQKEGMFRKCSVIVLIYLLAWPLQGLCIEMAKHMWDFLPESRYYSFLKEIIYKVKNGYKDCNYQKLFREFWQQSPLTHKKFVIEEECAIGSLLLDLLQIKDKENIKLILKDAATPDREKFIFSGYGYDLCEKLMYEDDMDFLVFIVQECISYKDLMIEFREEFERYIKPFHLKMTLEEQKAKWNKVFQLLNDLTQKLDKVRCVEEGSNGPVKRLSSLKNNRASLRNFKRYCNFLNISEH